MLALPARNVLALMDPTEVRRVTEALFETETVPQAEVQEIILKLIASERDGYYNTLIRTLGASAIPRVLDGKNAPSLLDSVVQYESPNGLRFTGATDKGINYSKTTNEDRIALRPDKGFAAVIDVMGGEVSSDQFGDELARVFGAHPGNMTATMNAIQEVVSCNSLLGDACYAAINIRRQAEGFLLSAWRAGDVRIAIIGPDEILRTESADETLARSMYNDRMFNIRERAINDPSNERLHNALRKEVIQAIDDLRNSPTRSTIKNSIFYSNQCKEPKPLWSDIVLAPGSIVLLMSDGITDSLETLEILRHTPRPLTGMGLMETIDRLTTNRMTNYNAIIAASYNRNFGDPFSDGFNQKPKPDNRGIAIIEIPR